MWAELLNRVLAEHIDRRIVKDGNQNSLIRNIVHTVFGGLDLAWLGRPKPFYSTKHGTINNAAIVVIMEKPFLLSSLACLAFKYSIFKQSCRALLFSNKKATQILNYILIWFFLNIFFVFYSLFVAGYWGKKQLILLSELSKRVSRFFVCNLIVNTYRTLANACVYERGGCACAWFVSRSDRVSSVNKFINRKCFTTAE